MPQVEDVITHLEERLALFEPRLEGLKDYERLNIQPETLREVQEAIELYKRRIFFIKAMLTDAHALMIDGHPDVDSRSVDTVVKADIDAQAKTILAAQALFVADESGEYCIDWR